MASTPYRCPRRTARGLPVSALHTTAAGWWPFSPAAMNRPRVPEKATETKGLPPPCVPVDAFVERVSRVVALGRMARASLTPALGFGALRNMICASRAGE